MNKASQDMDFEKSIIYREQIKELKAIASSQIIQYERELDEDIFVFKTILDKAFICVLNMRDGKILGKSSTSIDLKNKITDNIYVRAGGVTKIGGKTETLTELNAVLPLQLFNPMAPANVTTNLKADFQTDFQLKANQLQAFSSSNI